jgi:hypothetical protein
MHGSARPGHAKIALVVAALLTAACLAGCDDTTQKGRADGNDAPTATVAEPSADQAATAKIAWTAKLDVIGQPVEAGPALLVLSKTPRGTVELISLDPSTGRTNFHMPFHPGGTPTGVAMVPRATETDAGRHLSVLRRRDLDSAGPALVAVDVRTGDVVSSTPVAVDDYEACSDGHDVCWSGFESRPGGIVQSPFGPMRDVIPGSAPRRWDLESGRTSEKTLQEGALRVGDHDLYVRGEGRLAKLVRIPGTWRTAWTQSVSVLVANGVASKYGWSFQHDEETNVYVGSLGKPFPPKVVRRYERGKSVRIDYASRYVTAGIDGRAGKRLWLRRGADPWCSLIRSFPESQARTLCVVGGSRVDRKGEETTYDDLVVEIQGVDPRTGEVGWTYTLAGKDAERAYVDDRAPLAPYGVVLPGDDGPVALDERSGALEHVAADTVLLCPAGADMVTAYGEKRVAGTLYATCDPDGKSTTGGLSVFGAAALDGTGQTRFVSMPGRVVAYRLD